MQKKSHILLELFLGIAKEKDMRKRMRIVKGEVYFPIIIGLHLVMWAIDLLLHGGPYTLSEGENPVQRVLGEVMSSWVITVIGFNLLMATRARWVERIFGGLDKMYLIHRRAGAIAIVLLFLHFGIVPRHPEFVIGKLLGFFALGLIFLGVVLSAAPLFKRRIPYNKWLSIHRLMGPFYLVGIWHAFSVHTLISQLPIVRTYVFGMALLGVVAWLYRVFLHRAFNPRRSYEITSVKKHGGKVLDLRMSPVGKSMKYSPGQFAFVSFTKTNPKESHPFTVASHPDEEGLRLAIKASGDFTECLQNEIRIGDPVRVEGPYGHFTLHKSTSGSQVWIAGGIGITPFLALVRDLQEPKRKVTLYWSVRTSEEAFFDEELCRLAEQTPELAYHLWQSNKDGRLTAKAIPEINDASDVYICGPEVFRDSLTNQLRAQGIKRRSIHSEEFAFR
jgi:predicted ferric reductase